MTDHYRTTPPDDLTPPGHDPRDTSNGGGGTGWGYTILANVSLWLAIGGLAGVAISALRAMGIGG